MFTPTITHDMLRELHQRLRNGIEFAGNPTDYFAAYDRHAYRLSTSGWQLVHGKAATNNRLVAISDRELYDRLKTASSPEACFDQIIADGMPYEGTSGEDCPLGLRYERGAYDRVTLPRPGQDPRVVTVDLDYETPLHWADAHWFDLGEATPVARVRTDCCEADREWSETHPSLEMKLWRTKAGRWVAEIADPAALSEEFDPAQSAWGEIAPGFAAHALWCRREVEVTDQARSVPLVAAALAARGASDPGAIAAWGQEAIRGDDLHCAARHDHDEEVVALRTMLIAAIGREADEVWQDGGQVLADWTWIQHGPHLPHRFGAVWSGLSDDEADSD